MNWKSWSLAGVLACATASPAAATAPGDQETFYLDQYRSVCQADASIQCTDPAGDGSLSGAECPGGPAPDLCTPAFIPGARVRATMTLIADDDTQDDAAPTPGFDDDNLIYTVLIEVHAGEESFTYANSFYAAEQPAFCAGPGIPCAVISQWFPVDEEDDALTILDTGAFVPPPNSVFGPLRTQLEALAQSKFGAPGVPFLRVFSQKPALLEDARATPQATVSQWRIQIDFVQP